MDPFFATLIALSVVLVGSAVFLLKKPRNKVQE